MAARASGRTPGWRRLTLKWSATAASAYRASPRDRSATKSSSRKRSRAASTAGRSRAVQRA
eukprot:4134411-Pyramimonas_sp.AAC.1